MFENKNNLFEVEVSSQALEKLAQSISYLILKLSFIKENKIQYVKLMRVVIPTFGE